MSEITIALHWWYIPIGFVLLGIFFAWKSNNTGGYLGGFFEGLIALACFITALATAITGAIV